MRIANLKKIIANISTKIGDLNSKKDHLLHEESDEETRVAKEDQQLMATSGQLESCDQWGKKLEKKVNKVMKSVQDDAKLCHKSILALHNERVRMRQDLHKQYTELKKGKDEAASIEHKGEETLN